MVVLIIILIEMNRTLEEHLEGNSSVTFECRYDRDGTIMCWTFTEDTPKANQSFDSLKANGWTVRLLRCTSRGNAY